MNKLFGKCLRSQMQKAHVKESELADALSYDPTYISKWINGSKLPSTRNADHIIEQMADFFAAHAQKGQKEAAARRAVIFDDLKKAYASDSSYLAFQSYNNHRMSFVDNQQSLLQLTRDACMQASQRYGRRISVTATFDLFRLYGKKFKQLMRELHESGVETVQLRMALNPDDLTADDFFYTASILNTIGCLNYIEMSIVAQNPEQPCILMINDLLYLQVLYNVPGEFYAVFSMDETVIQTFSHICRQITENAEKLLDPTDPDSLKRTNVQLDSYSDRRQWLFFNEPPAMLFPEDIMDSLIANAKAGKDDEYAGYLANLKNIFSKHTRRSKIDLVLYSSILKQYLSGGTVCVGNISHCLTAEQTRRHLRYLSEIMTENPDFSIYLIRDTVVVSEELRNSPSIFVDTYGCYIENSKKASNGNFHISMDRRIRDAFQRFFENILSQSYCIRLTAEDLLHYL